MRIAAKALATQLKKGLAPLYAVHGPEALVALEAADRIRAAAKAKGFVEREIFVAEPGVDWGRLDAAASNLSLFANQRLVEIHVPGGKPGVDGARAIETWCRKLSEDTITLVTLPALEWQQLKSGWFGALDAAGTVVEAKPIARVELAEWLAERLSRQSQKASIETLEWLADRVEGNLLAARQEVEKLALLLPAGEVTLDAIRDAVTDVSRFERDGLLEAIHAGDASRIARIVPSLKAEGEVLPLVLWTLSEEIRKVMAVAAGQSPRGWSAPEATARLNKTARRHTPESFGHLLLRAHRIDRMIKGVETGDPWDNILQLSLELAGRAALVRDAA